MLVGADIDTLNIRRAKGPPRADRLNSIDRRMDHAVTAVFFGPYIGDNETLAKSVGDNFRRVSITESAHAERAFQNCTRPGQAHFRQHRSANAPLRPDAAVIAFYLTTGFVAFRHTGTETGADRERMDHSVGI